jgi:hypothetical protein
MELLTAELSASFVAFDEHAAAEVVSARAVLEDTYVSNLLNADAHVDNKLTTELANDIVAYEVRLAAELEATDDNYSRKLCIGESIFNEYLLSRRRL